MLASSLEAKLQRTIGYTQTSGRNNWSSKVQQRKNKYALQSIHCNAWQWIWPSSAPFLTRDGEYASGLCTSLRSSITCRRSSMWLVARSWQRYAFARRGPPEPQPEGPSELTQGLPRYHTLYLRYHITLYYIPAYLSIATRSQQTSCWDRTYIARG